MAKAGDAQNEITRFVGENMRRHRLHRGWSLSQLSERLQELGHPLGVTVISKMELGPRTITVDDLVALANAFQVTPAVLLAEPAFATHEDAVQLVDELLQLQDRAAAAEEAAERARIDAEDLDAQVTVATQKALQDPVLKRIYIEATRTRREQQFESELTARRTARRKQEPRARAIKEMKR